MLGCSSSATLLRAVVAYQRDCSAVVRVRGTRPTWWAGRPADATCLSVCLSISQAQQQRSCTTVSCDVMDSDVCIARSQLASPLTAAAIATGSADVPFIRP